MKLLRNLLTLVALAVFFQLGSAFGNACLNTYSGRTDKNRLRTSAIYTSMGAVILPAENPSLDLPENLPKDVKELMTWLNQRNPQQLLEIKDKLTKTFAEDKAGSFAKKDENGNTSPFYVTTNPIPLPIPRSYYERLVQSTKGLFESKNELLQLFYSKEKVTVEDLKKIAIQSTPESVLQDVISYIYGNQYFEKGIVSDVMKDYRFISVVGIDHALTTVKEMKPLGFEFNGGSPSGVSNTRSIFEAYKKVLPQFADLFDRLLEADKTFENFKKTMDAHGLYWTGKKEGISVVVSPGIFNGAHPDVVTIAENSGMPLVQMSDLYVDRSGLLRLNQKGIDSKNHPLVTSIYSRIEESSLLSATSSKKDLGFKIPTKLKKIEIDNLKSKGVSITEGIAYEFIKNERGEVVDVQRDQLGNPLKTVILNARLGKDPSLLPGEIYPETDILDLITHRKLYVSNIGGRTLDIKPLFSLIADYFAPIHTSGPIFSPPPTLKLNDQALSRKEYEKFYSKPKNYVVKVADESGGNGVYVLSQKSDSEIREVIRMVKEDQDRVAKAREIGQNLVASFTIQEFVNSAVITTVIPKDGQAQLVTVIPDLRNFVLMSPDGNVSSGAMGFLGRSAPHGSAISNTSKGGDYFVPLVYKELPSLTQTMKSKRTQRAKRNLTKPQGQLTSSDEKALNLFLGSLGVLTHMQKMFRSEDGQYKAYMGQYNWINKDTSARLSDEFRAVMHILGPEFRPLQSLFDRRSANIMSDKLFRHELSLFVDKMKNLPSNEWPYMGVSPSVKHWLVDWKTFEYRGEI